MGIVSTIIELEHEREILNSMVSSSKYDSIVLLEQSRKVDKLIVKYMIEKKKLHNHLEFSKVNRLLNNFITVSCDR